MKIGYTHTINYFQKVDGLGWVFQSFRTTETSVRSHLRSLIRQKRAGTVRTIDTIRLK